MSCPSGGRRGAAPLVVGLLSIAMAAACSPAPGPTDHPARTSRSAAGTDGSLPQPAPAPGGPSADPLATGEPRPRGSPGRGGTTPPGSTSLQRVASRYVTGLTLAALSDVLAAHGVSCIAAEGTAGHAEWSCSGTDPTGAVDYSVAIEGADENRIRHVTALVTQYGPPDLELAAGFLGDIASVDYRGADPGRARDWVRAWLNGAAPSDEVMLGDGALALEGTLESSSLDLVAPEIVDR